MRVESRVEHPLLPLGFFRRKNFAAPLVATAAANFAYMGGFMLAPRLVQDVFAYSVTMTAYAMLVRPLVFSVVAPAAGYLAVRVGERLAAVTGTACVVVSMLLFSLGARGEVIGLVFAGLALSGFGLGVASPSLSSSVANAVDSGDLGIASATHSMVSQIGVVAGIQVLTTIEATRSGANGFATAYAAGGAIAVIGVIAAGFVRSADRRVLA
ncbi:MAG: MFS transporter [Acidimicrobiia bacterium]|nr:MFS transporter [Acidimicrobiia bacterium]